MKEHPILFSTPMIQAILEGRKTMTRRIIKPQPDDDGLWDDTNFPRSLQSTLKGWNGSTETGQSKEWKCPFGEVGDILWVRETWKPKYVKGCLDEFRIVYPDNYPWFYKADGESERGYGSWKPSIFMPKEACRIFLEITGIRVERLNSISWDDAVAEGCPGYRPIQDEPTMQFERLWKSINGEESFEKNPWVWVIEFKKIDK